MTFISIILTIAAIVASAIIMTYLMIKASGG